MDSSIHEALEQRRNFAAQPMQREIRIAAFVHTIAPSIFGSANGCFT
jgi:hypothetical protein